MDLRKLGRKYSAAWVLAVFAFSSTYHLVSSYAMLPAVDCTKAAYNTEAACKKTQETAGCWVNSPTKPEIGKCDWNTTTKKCYCNGALITASLDSGSTDTTVTSADTTTSDTMTMSTLLQ